MHSKVGVHNVRRILCVFPATREMLPHLIEWQRRWDYPFSFACEATLNIARQTEILELMRQARFDTVFVGIETPELGELKYGLEVVSGIIRGLDTDTADTEANLKQSR